AFSEKDVRVEVNRQVRIDIGLQPGAVTTQITVTEAAPELQTETAEVNSEISQTQLNALPITSSAGRNYQALYTIIPGASAVQEKNSTSANPSRSMSVNINGNSYHGNTTRIDGAVNYYGWLPYLIAYVPRGRHRKRKLHHQRLHRRARAGRWRSHQDQHQERRVRNFTAAAGSTTRMPP